MFQKRRRKPGEDPTSLGTLAQIRFGVAERDIDRALQYSAELGCPIGEALVVLGVLSRLEVQSLLGDQQLLRRKSGPTVRRLLRNVRARSDELSGKVGQLEKLALEVAGKLQ